MVFLKDVCGKASSSIAQKDLEGREGQYPIYGAAGYIKDVDFYHQDKPYVAIVKDGAGVGRVMCLPAFSSVIGTLQYIIPTPDTDVRYLAYAMEHMNLAKYNTGATIPHIYFKDYCLEMLPMHSWKEQQSIAKRLTKVDSLIALRKQQLAKLDELVKSRFVEMFELHSWPKSKAGTFMDDMRNGVSPSNTGTHKAHVLTLSAITQGAFDRSAWKEGDFDCIPSEDKRVSTCDFYICRGNGNRNLVGSGVYSKENLYDLVFPDTVIATRVDTNMVRLPFLCEAWKRPSIRSQIESGARTTNGTFKINQKVIANIDISIPPIELQDSFVTFVEQTDKSKLAIQQSLEKLETLKKSLMQKYFG